MAIKATRPAQPHEVIAPPAAAAPATSEPAAPAPPASALVPKDKRLAALRRFATTITIFTVVGHLWLGLETPWAAPVVSTLTSYAAALLLEMIDAWGHGRRAEYRGGVLRLVNFLLPSHIAGMAIALLIYPGGMLWPFAFAAVVAAGAKYLWRAPVNGRMRHVFNPSNLGISATLVIFPWVGIGMPYHFTATFGGPLDWIIPALLLMSGLMINTQLTGKWPLIAGWVGGFALQAILRAVFTDISVLGALAPMTGVAFILFTNYMITDPGTTPTGKRNQVAFGLASAAAYAFFMLIHVSYGIFFCLVVVCAGRGLYLWARHTRAKTTERRLS
ncbi:enediyne biosynthesis protein UnbU [Lentzea kentuckyensis]|uniref:enediyne biosynthesis protein UnbU n=1 Tax=Lentzea kentuckyensis TaxID=360086 RepID=UPI001B80899F|nr:enediyne biosynthesis protein UnbU [Lentzea kentuckyensis]